jgi:cytosine/adenosine deaminase-related metal-dependent hydrolase
MYTLEAETLKQVRQLADREHVPVIIHLAETQDE